MIVIAFPGQKGGSGKSTTCVNLGVELAQQGLRVLVLDADPQGSLPSWYDAARAHEESHPGYAYPTVVGAQGNIKKTIQAVGPAFDVALIDLPGRDAEVQRQALLAADAAILVVAPGTFDVWSLERTIDYCLQAQSLRQELDELAGGHRPLELAFLRNRFAPRQNLSRQVGRILAGSGIEVLKTILHHRVAFGEAPAEGIGVSLYGQSSARKEIRALAKEVRRTYLSEPNETPHAKGA